MPAPAMSCTASRKASALVEYLQYPGAEQYQGQYQLGAHSISWEPEGAPCHQNLTLASSVRLVGMQSPLSASTPQRRSPEGGIAQRSEAAAAWAGTKRASAH